MAIVAILRFESETRLSISKLHEMTAEGLRKARLFKVRTEASRRVGFGEERNDCKTTCIVYGELVNLKSSNASNPFLFFLPEMAG